MSTGKNVTNGYTEHGLRMQENIGSWVTDASLLQAVTAFILFPILPSFQLHKYQLLFRYYSGTIHLMHILVTSEH